jgi:hypothetical protein
VEVSFQGTFFKHAFFKAYKYKIVEEKILQKLELCFHQICLGRFAKMYNMAKNVKERVTKVDESMH